VLLVDRFKENKYAEIVTVAFGFLFVAIALHHRLWRGEVPLGQDAQYHYLWLNNFTHQLSQGELYPRWLADTNYRYGSPTMVFYPPLLAYFGATFQLLGFDFARTIAAVFTGISFSAGLLGYCCKRQSWGFIPAVAVGTFLIFSAYPLQNLYSRGAFAEALAIPLVPLGIWMADASLRAPKYRIGLAIVALLLALTHLPSLLLYAIFWLSYIAIVHRRSPPVELLLTLLAVFAGWGVSSFFILPALLEKSWVSVETMKSVSGGYDANLFGAPELTGVGARMLGLWREELRMFLVCTIVASVLCLKNVKLRGALLLFVATFGALSFAMSNWSRPIWASIELLQNVQFPWRLLGLLSVVTAIGAGLALRASSNLAIRAIVLFILCGLLVFDLRDAKRMVSDAPTLNEPRWYLEEPRFVALRDRIQLAVEQPLAGMRADAPEYRPKAEEGDTYEPKPGTPPVQIDSGTVNIDRWQVRTRVVTTDSPTDARVTFRVYDYPAWNLYIDGEAAATDRSPEGTIVARVPAGKHRLELKYEWTMALALGTVLSLISLGFIFAVYVMPSLLPRWVRHANRAYGTDI